MSPAIIDRCSFNVADMSVSSPEPLEDGVLFQLKVLRTEQGVGDVYDPVQSSR